MNMDKTVVIKPTFDCNFHCWYCTDRRKLHSKLANRRSLLVSEWETLLKHLFQYEFNTLTLSGAEPTLYGHYNKLIEMLSTIPYKNTTLMTNGTNLSYVDVSYFNYVEISFADIDKKGFRKNRGRPKAEFEFQYSSIVKYLKNKRNIAVNCIPLTQDRLLKLDKILYLSEVLGFDDVNLQPIEGNFNIIPITEKCLKLFKDKIYNKIPKKFLHHVNTVLPVLENGLTGIYRSSPCTIPQNQLIILGNGDVHFCNIIEYTHEKEGQIDIKRNTLQEMFNKINEFEKTRSRYCYRCPMQLH